MIARREVSPADAELVSDLLTASRPDEPDDPLQTRYELKGPIRPDSIQRRALWELGGRVVGYSQAGHLPWELAPERFCWLAVAAPPDVVGTPLLGELQDATIEWLLEDEPFVLDYSVWEDEPAQIESIEARGFVRDRLSKAWELDLVAHAEEILDGRERSRRRMAEQGVELLTLAADRDPEKLGKVLRLINESQRDIPSTKPIHDGTLEELERWLVSPVVRTDRYWLARSGEEIVGLSYLSFPPRRGHVWTGYTASLPGYRGRGIARAVKMETLGQAVELGVERVRTDNDSENAPMLHINETLGYRRIPGVLSYLRRL